MYKFINMVNISVVCGKKKLRLSSIIMIDNNCVKIQLKTLRVQLQCIYLAKVLIFTWQQLLSNGSQAKSQQETFLHCKFYQPIRSITRVGLPIFNERNALRSPQIDSRQYNCWSGGSVIRTQINRYSAAKGPPGSAGGVLPGLTNTVTRTYDPRHILLLL